MGRWEGNRDTFSLYIFLVMMITLHFFHFFTLLYTSCSLLYNCCNQLASLLPSIFDSYHYLSFNCDLWSSHPYFCLPTVWGYLRFFLMSCWVFLLMFVWLDDSVSCSVTITSFSGNTTLIFFRGTTCSIHMVLMGQPILHNPKVILDLGPAGLCLLFSLVIVTTSRMIL